MLTVKGACEERFSWERRRNAEAAKINWMFTIERARAKLGRAYPAPAGHPVKAAA